MAESCPKMISTFKSPRYETAGRVAGVIVSTLERQASWQISWQWCEHTVCIVKLACRYVKHSSSGSLHHYDALCISVPTCRSSATRTIYAGGEWAVCSHRINDEGGLGDKQAQLALLLLAFHP